MSTPDYTPLSTRAAGCDSIVEALVPNRSDTAFDELAAATFIDNGVPVPVSPVDQLLMAFARRLLTDRSLGGTGVVQLPRSKHRSALLLAITSHLLCRRSPASLSGPVVLIGLDVDLATQLRSLSVANHRRMGLSAGNPLSAHRLTRMGDLVPVIGSDVGTADTSLVYCKTRNGTPTLNCRPPLVILDATSVNTPSARANAIEWALAHHAEAIIAVGDIGDDSLIQTVSDAAVVPTVLAVNETITQALVDELGRGERTLSTLSSMGVLWRVPPQVHLHRVGDDETNEAVTKAFKTLAFKPAGPLPVELERPLNLLRNGARLAARVKDYRTACTNNPRPGEMPLLRMLERSTTMPAAWRHWETANLGALKTAVKHLWRELESDNPKLRELWRVLERLHRDGVESVVIRCHSRAAAEATRVSLSSGTRSAEQEELWELIKENVIVTTSKERFAAGSFGAQILTGAPPPWMLSSLVGIEATATHVLVYEAEEAILRRQAQRWAQGCGSWQRAVCRTFGAPAPAPVTSPVPPPVAAATPSTLRALNVPGLSLTDVLDAAAELLDPPERRPDPASTAFTGSSRSCVPVDLRDGRTWWCVNEGDRETPVLTLGAGGHENRPVRDLRPGDRIIVPAGEGAESIHARLVTASRTSNDDVQSLDLILSQFRAAARHVITSSATQQAAADRVRVAGAEAPGQLPAWGKGTTIAPREPGDVAAVFKAAGRPCPDLPLIYAVADRLRGLNRTLGRFISAIAAGRGRDTLNQLRALVGDAADELLDEFIVAEVVSVGPARNVPANVAGRIR
ncbi:MAG: hypothetical protein ACRD2W_21630 [Acidimicrobiales bacterium]